MSTAGERIRGTSFAKIEAITREIETLEERLSTGTMSIGAMTNEAIFNQQIGQVYLCVARYLSGVGASSQATAITSRDNAGNNLVTSLTTNNIEWVLGSAATGRIDIQNNNGGSTTVNYSVYRLI